jgi:hypothetical protein
MTNHPLFTAYLKELSAVTQQGDAREESFYSALQEMMEAVAKATGRAHARARHHPAKAHRSAHICGICGFGLVVSLPLCGGLWYNGCPLTCRAGVTIG